MPIVFLIRKFYIYAIQTGHNHNIKMKRQLIILASIFCFLCHTSLFAQAHLGISEIEIENLYPGKTFNQGTTNSSVYYIYAVMPLGTFYYYFDASGVTTSCVQIPNSVMDLNSQVDIYNGKYVTTSKTSWTAYLDGGGSMYIRLLYSDDFKFYYFTYRNAE